jgi:DtxR family Mn-dependent transcriptional regulator
MVTPPSGLSPSVEDYLKAIYTLCQRGGAATTNAIAEALSVQPASVTGMVKRLAESEYLEHAPYHGVRLTPAGTREALRVVRRHRVLETYLKEKLGYSWEGVHHEAERLEHAASDELIERMAAALENPSHDPHGAPIPTRSGTVEAAELATLSEAEAGTEVEITAVQDEDPDLLREIEDWGLVPGARLWIQERDDHDGAVTVGLHRTDSESRRVPPGLARRIYVRPLA